jgi:hypothetical protein
MAGKKKGSKTAWKKVIREYDARTGYQSEPTRQYRNPKATTGQSARANSDVFVRGRRVGESGWAGRRQK